MKNLLVVMLVFVGCILSGCTETDNTPISEFIVCEEDNTLDHEGVYASFVNIPAHRIIAVRKNTMCWGLQTRPITGVLKIFGPKSDTVTVIWSTGKRLSDPVTVECVDQICKLLVAGPDDLPVVRTF